MNPLSELSRETVSVTRVLLVEDNVGFAYGIRDALVRQSRQVFEVEEVRNLADAVAFLGKNQADVVLLDLGLPDSARIHTFDAVRRAAPEVPVIILTVLNDDDVALAAMRAGAQDYLIKDDINVTLLTRAIKYAIERDRIGKEMYRLSARLLQFQDDERRRMARAIHDMTGQNIAALSMTISALNQWAARIPEEAQKLLENIMEQVSRCGSDLRTMAYLLHPPLIEELGLVGAARDYADGFAERSGIRVDLDIPKDLGRLPKDVELALFRVMQECLTNIHQHAESSSASILFALGDDEVLLKVSDRGRGISQNASTGTLQGVQLGVGIAGMRERIDQLGGRFDLESSDQGTTVTVRLPLSDPGR
jgi:signal transduction histidine kinase